MLKLRAGVKRVTGATTHEMATIVNDEPVPISRLPDAALIEITAEEDTGGFLLLRFAGDGSSAGDTWHETLEDARAQAEYEYELEARGWREVAEEE